MTKNHATERYSPPYDMYNQEATTAGFEELLTQSYRVIVNQKGHLIVFLVL